MANGPTKYHVKNTYGVHHIQSASQSKISEILERQLAISADKTQELLYMGSIWIDHERLREDIEIKKGAYLRVHTDPRRFPAEKVSWDKVILHEDEDFVIVNKPMGLPVHATVDNFVENVVFHLGKELKCDIFVTQRLDMATTGVLLLAKTKTFQSEFNKLLRDRGIKKNYLARVEKRLIPGEVVHYMEQSLKAPKVVQKEFKENWMECRLIIESVNEIESDFDLEIELLTGRTHQVRAQLSDLGAPILGDKMYGSKRENPWVPSNYKPTESIALRSHRLEFHHPLSKKHFIFSSN